ncbi:hypothetical protein, partial [Deinococcus ruber]|uniref:hypothetical protein n=1 Tax=Deinococcus ruber TaxID=1848197 RepID=UPI001E4D2CD5
GQPSSPVATFRRVTRHPGSVTVAQHRDLRHGLLDVSEVNRGQFNVGRAVVLVQALQLPGIGTI